MLKLLFIPLLCVCFANGENIPDQSEVRYKNPKYIQDIQVVTFRRRRSDPYKTNVTLTTYHSWGNNITVRAVYLMEDGRTFNLTLKVCGVMDQIWLVELMRQKSDVTFDCPVRAGTHRYFNLDVIPKVFPAPMPSTPKGRSCRILVECFITATKEKVLAVALHVNIKLK